MLQTFDERNRELVVNIAGRLTHRDEACVSPFDSVVQGGDAVWEGLRLFNGRIFALEEHLDRLRRSAQALAFTDIPSAEEITEQIRRTLVANEMHDGVHVRLTLTRGLKITSGLDPRLNQSGPTLIVLAEHQAPTDHGAGIRLMTSSVRRQRADSLDPKIQHANLLTSILAKVQANVAGADDALMLDDAGFVAQTNACHVFLVREDVAGTPTTRACPEGITRGSVLGLCERHGYRTSVGDYSLVDVYTADEVFVTGTMSGLTPVLAVDGRIIGDGRPGPVTRHLTAGYGELSASRGTVIA